MEAEQQHLALRHRAAKGPSFGRLDLMIVQVQKVVAKEQSLVRALDSGEHSRDGTFFPTIDIGELHTERSSLWVK